MRVTVYLLAIVAVLVLFAKYSTLLIADDVAYTNVYMFCTSLAWAVGLLAFRLNVTEYKTKHILSALTLLSFGEVLDELFFEPTIIQWNEVVLLLAVSVWLSIKLSKQK